MGSLKIGSTTINDVKFGTNQVTKVYLGTNLIWSSGAAPSYSAELTAILARATTEGFTQPSSATLTAMDTLIAAYKTSGVWALQDRIYNFAYNNTALESFSRIDWKNPSTSPLILYNSVTYSAEGFQGNGVDGHINTQFVPSTNGVNYTQNNAGRTAWIYTVGASSNQVIDGNGSANNFFFINVNLNHRINSSNNLTSVVDLTGSGLKSINRYTSVNVGITNRTIYEDNSESSFALPTTAQYILRNGTGYSDHTVSMYFIGASIADSSITTTKTGAVRNAYNTYLSAIGLTPNTNT